MNELISASIPTLINMVLEYGSLASKPELSEEEADRMDELLIYATNDPVFAFWLDEFDHCLGHRLGLLDEASQKSYQEQQRTLCRLISDKSLDAIVNIHEPQSMTSYPPSEVQDLIHAACSNTSRSQFRIPPRDKPIRHASH